LQVEDEEEEEEEEDNHTVASDVRRQNVNTPPHPTP